MIRSSVPIPKCYLGHVLHGHVLWVYMALCLLAISPQTSDNELFPCMDDQPPLVQLISSCQQEVFSCQQEIPGILALQNLGTYVPPNGNADISQMKCRHLPTEVCLPGVQMKTPPNVSASTSIGNAATSESNTDPPNGSEACIWSLIHFQS